MIKRISWNKGIKHTEETRRKMSESHKKIGTGGWNRGKKLSEDHKNKIRDGVKGTKWTAEQKLNVSGENSHCWRKKVGYRGIHLWVEKWKGKAVICEKCGEKKNRVSWANKDHEYKRILDDYISFCPKCHGEYDKNNNLRKRI